MVGAASGGWQVSNCGGGDGLLTEAGSVAG